MLWQRFSGNQICKSVTTNSLAMKFMLFDDNILAESFDYSRVQASGFCALPLS